MGKKAVGRPLSCACADCKHPLMAESSAIPCQVQPICLLTVGGSGLTPGLPLPSCHHPSGWQDPAAEEHVPGEGLQPLD